MQTSILNATVVQRERFIRSIDAEPRLEHVDIVNWAGLGGVRYIPTEVVSAAAAQAQSEGGDAQEEKDPNNVNADQVRNGISEQDESTKDLIDHRNIQLVDQLRHSDSAFSLGEGGDPRELCRTRGDRVQTANNFLFSPSADLRICVRFGMVSMETDVSELLALVVKTGVELDDQVAQLNNMSEVIRRGIEQAQGELRRESDEALLQEGILRHVPIVGSFVNWFSPVTEKPTIKGRCLSLNEGRVSSTGPLYETKAMANGGATVGSSDEDAVAPNEVTEPKEEVTDVPESGKAEAANTEE